ncbi:MAG: chromosome segregation protein SMC [Armatimonadetes bacterium]|nr:chromosome segregation protein SMC [Armatimonadota bacterium]
MNFGAPALRLKRVRIVGFKTFAEKTEFDLDGELVAIVGPNGCGKSNIVDAILWGLGEPKPRNLRAANATEVIFAGSQNRKAHSYAEVMLLFDNEDGSLPVDTPEVSITRRVHRNGDSEYFLNKQACRQKDIFDVLADSGLGKAGYAIVGQKEIDAALAASAEDRRAWIDEAAGVQRYRAKRHEALRRLEQTQDHLARVEDILNEIERQRGPLEAEAEIARKYKAAQHELRGVESALMMVEVAQAIGDLREVEARINTGTARSKNVGRELESLSVELDVAQSQLAELDRKLDALADLQRSTFAAKERALARITLCEQRLTSLDELEQSLNTQVEAESQRLEQLDADLEQAKVEEAELESRLEALQIAAGQSTESAHAVTLALKSLSERIDQAKTLEHARLRWQTENEFAAKRQKEIRRELEGIEEGASQLEQGVAEAQLEVDRLQAELAKFKSDEEAREAFAKETRAKLAALEREVSQISAEIGALTGRKRGLESTIESLDGLSLGSRSVLEGVENRELPDRYTPVGLAISVPTDLATAIETALGASVNDLIVPHESDAKAAIEFLKKSRGGRATFQPLSLMRSRRDDPELDRLLGTSGIIGVAADLVECDPEFRPAIASLLARTVITESLDVALRHAKSRGWSKLVTLDGEVVHASGAVSGGVAARTGHGVVHRKSELEAVELEIAKLEKARDALHKQKEAIEMQASSAQSQMVDLGEQTAVVEAHAEAVQWRDQLVAESRESSRQKDRLTGELERLAKQGEEPQLPEDITALEAEREETLTRAARESADAEAARQQLVELRSRVDQARTRRRDTERRLDLESSSGEQRTKRLGGLNTEREQIREEIVHQRQEITETDARIQKQAKEIESAGQDRSRQLEKSFQVSEQIKELENQSRDLSTLMHQAELERAKLDSKRAAALQRLMEAYEITEEEALLQAPNLEIPDDATTTVNRLRREIRAMGDVNLGAIESFERLTERYEELSTQRNDILEGKEQVEASIRELDKLTRDRFATTFEAVKTEFQTLFTRLFGGGEGTIMLTKPDNLLETGVEVEVTVPGKTKKRLELLSGGERALAASALIFSLLKVKPSPLVIFDEVDAPLDGRNVERFIEVMREFGKRSQFLCITHNNLTIEASPIWFGVTMQEPGITSVIPYRTTGGQTAGRVYVQGN